MKKETKERLVILRQELEDVKAEINELEIQAEDLEEEIAELDGKLIS